MIYYHVIGRPKRGAEIDETWLQSEGRQFFCRECGTRLHEIGPTSVKVTSEVMVGKLIIFGSPRIGIARHDFLNSLLLDTSSSFTFGAVLGPSGTQIPNFSTYSSKLGRVPIRSRSPLDAEPCATCGRIVFTGMRGPNRYVVSRNGLAREAYESINGGLLLREDIFKTIHPRLVDELHSEKITVESRGYDCFFGRELEYEDAPAGDPPLPRARPLDFDKSQLGPEPTFDHASPRYTGELPPPQILARFPNWIQALDEEDLPGQDETTIKPDAVQSFISDTTEHTAADVELPSGKVLPAMLGLADGNVESVTVYSGEWMVKIDERKWLPEQWALSTRYHGNTDDFPLTVRSRLDSARTGRKITLVLFPDGTVESR